MATETYALAAFVGLTEPVPSAGALTREVIDDAAIPVQLLGVTVGADVRFDFQVALDAGQKTALDALVAAHTGVPAPGGDVTAQGNLVVAQEARNEDGSSIVAARHLQLGQARFVRTDDGTAKMNIDGRALGTPVVVWNGTGGADTGGDWTVDGIGSEGPGAAHAGTNGWNTGLAALNDDTRFDSGADADVAGTYSELTFWMNPQAFPPGAKLKIQWQDAGNSVVGANLNVENYVVNMDLGVWQKVAIPIADFNLTADVAKVRLRYRQEAGQHHWFDDLELIPTGAGPYRFRVEAPDVQTRYHLTMMVLVLSAPSSGWNASAFANIAAGLDAGVLVRQRRKSTGETLWSINSKTNADLFGRFHPQDDITFADGDLLMGFMLKPGQASVVITDDDVLDVVIRDDLSALSACRAYAHYGVEVVA